MILWPFHHSKISGVVDRLQSIVNNCIKLAFVLPWYSKKGVYSMDSIHMYTNHGSSLIFD